MFNPSAYQNAGGLDYYHQQALEQQNMNAQNEAKTSLANTAALQAKQDLQQSQEAWDLKKAQAESSGQLASKFLSNWSDSLKTVQGMYGGATDIIKSAMQSLSGGGSGGSSGSSGIPGFDEVLKGMQDSYKDYQTNFEPAAKTFLNQASTEMGMRNQAIGRLNEYATPDYAGVRGRAAADVTAQDEMARQALTRKMMGMGIDPSAGKFGALTRKSYLDQARDTAVAMNLAARGEKERAAGVTSQVVSALHPEQTAAAGTNILGAGQKMLANQGALVKSAADVQNARINTVGNLANAAGNLATGYSNAVMQPQAEMAGYMMGGGGALPTSGSTGGTTSNYGLLTPQQVATMRTSKVGQQILTARGIS